MSNGLKEVKCFPHFSIMEAENLLLFFLCKIDFYFTHENQKRYIPLAKVQLFVLIWRNKNRFYTEKIKYPIYLSQNRAHMIFQCIFSPINIQRGFTPNFSHLGPRLCSNPSHLFLSPISHPFMHSSIVYLKSENFHCCNNCMISI